jgi:diketogulonate reductase-like aldo/keto reductase/GNAT superfamily N-acetyltransferase
VYEIGPVRTDEVAQLPEIERRASALFLAYPFTAALPEILPSAAAFERAQKAGLLWVARDEAHAPVGFALAEDDGDALHLEELDVLPEHGRQGLGERLLRAVIRRAQASARPVTLTTFRDIPWNAPFYARLGFRTLSLDQLSPALAAHVDRETARGLPLDLRVAMRLEAHRGRRIVQGLSAPAFLYGTAWKEERTEDLTRTALEAGFTGIDTANQRKHYVEAAAGTAVAALLAKGRLVREDLFLQTKFTSLRGQDHRLPYDRTASPELQVAQSVQSSLEHLQTMYLDSYILHGPSSARGLTDHDWAVWRAMEAQHDAERARLLGISNVSLEQLRTLHAAARVKPAFVQNRCFASSAWDHDMRQFCSANGITYQAFSLLTANPAALRSAAVTRAAKRTGVMPAQVVFRFALQVGMIPLTGTASPAHMREDLASFDFALDEAEVRAIESAGAPRAALH